VEDLLEYHKFACMDRSGLWLTRAGGECCMEFQYRATTKRNGGIFCDGTRHYIGRGELSSGWF
jgi:hypothetical protein